MKLNRLKDISFTKITKMIPFIVFHYVIIILLRRNWKLRKKPPMLKKNCVLTVLHTEIKLRQIGGHYGLVRTRWNLII